MADKGGIALSKPVAAGIIAALGIAFGAGVKARSSLFDAEAKPLQVAASSFGPLQVDAAVTAEQVRQLATTMGALGLKLDDTIKEVSGLNARLARIEGAQAAAEAAAKKP